jgi:ring-1,2-phenylacetyl-CoA epoxidase subunit PaaE
MSTRPAEYPPAIVPSGALTIQVIRREILARDVITLYFATPGTRRAPAPYLPGQFVTLMLPGQYETLYRSYSLCGSGDPREPWEVTVKRVHRGLISNYLFDLIQVGMVLQATTPRGSFVLPQPIRHDAHIVFVAAGSGITPIRGMVRALAALKPEQRPHVQLHYASRSLEEIIYRAELAQINPDQSWLRQWHYLSARGERMTPEAIFANAGSLPRATHWFMCGPDALSRELQETLVARNVPPALIHTEVFADQSKRRPLLPGAAAGPTVARVAIRDTGATIDVRSHETLLDALERHGYRPDFSCRAGSCGTCKLRVLGGRVSASSSALTASERAAGYVLSCVARPQGDVLLLSGGRPPAAGRASGTSAILDRAAAKLRLRVAVLITMAVVLSAIWTFTSHKPVRASSNSNSTPAVSNPGDFNPPSGNNPPSFPQPQPPSIGTSSS